MRIRELAGAVLGVQQRAWSTPPTGRTVLGDRRTLASVQPATARDIDSLGAVDACIGLVSETIGCMPVDVFRRGRDGALVPVPDNEVPAIVANPSPRPQITTQMWLTQFVRSLRMRGNAFGLVTRFTPDGWPDRIELLNPSSIGYERRDGVERWWHYTAGRRAEVQLWQEGGQLWHVPYNAEPGDVLGIDVISRAAIELGIAVAARQYGADFYWSGGNPTAVLSTEQKLSPAMAKETIELWDEVTATRGRSPRVVSGGLTYTPLQVTPDQARLLEVMQATAADVCRWFRVPPEEIGSSSGDGLTYVNVEGRGMQFLRNLTPTIRTTQDVWSALLPPGMFVRLVPEVLLMTNAATRSQILASDIRAGIRTPNEARAKLDLPAKPAADQLLWPPFSTSDPANQPSTGGARP